MLEFLRAKAMDRKLRLFAVACCRRLPQDHLLPDELIAEALALAEHMSEGTATFQDWRAIHDALNGRTLGDGIVAIVSTLYHDIRAGVLRMTDAVTRAVSYMEARRGTKGHALAALLRDILGPLPFRPMTVHPDVVAWNDRLVVRLAQAIYDERRWGDMPLLGDALLDAGCDNEEVLAHCRDGGEHVRGCWVVDLLLGKS
jgi:hypothetical protein